MRLFFQLYWYFRQEWKRYSSSAILLITIAILQLIPPKVVGYIIDSIIEWRFTNLKTLTWIGVLLSIAIVTYFLRYIWRILLFSAAYQLAVELHKSFYHQLSLQNPEFYLRYRTGDLIARVINDVDRVVFAAGEGVLTLIDSLVIGCTVLIVMSIQISWKLTLLALFPILIMSLVLRSYSKRLHKFCILAQVAFSSLNNRVQENLTSIRMIKSFGLEDYQSSLFSIDVTNTEKKNMCIARIDALFDPIIYIAIGIANLLTIGGGSWMIIHNLLTLGQLTSFSMYLNMMIWPMLSLAWMFNIVERGSAAYNRILNVLIEKPVINNSTKEVPKSPGILIATINAFSYPHTEHSLLKKIEFTLYPGQMLGICGPTGSGKSTILSLLQRHFDITEGEIYYNDIPLTEIKLDDWRSRLAVVNQTPFLFSDTIANNIALGCPNATQKKIEQVAKIANIHDDIILLPQGYNTEVGERGVMLSGGQRQRISIARALLMHAEILILDDALSAVDKRTEYQILHNLKKWKTEYTIIIISAHRLSALIEANEILVLQHGCIIQHGQHEWLSQQEGWYCDMYRYQQLYSVLENTSEILSKKGESDVNA